VEQDLFSFDEPEEPANPVAAVNTSYSWEWWDPWPENLTQRQQVMYQISRDMRAFAEASDDEERLFFADRVAAYQDFVRTMDGDQPHSQQAEPAAAPGDDVAPSLST
jgi:hypothetical protein